MILLLKNYFFYKIEILVFFIYLCLPESVDDDGEATTQTDGINNNIKMPNTHC